MRKIFFNGFPGILLRIIRFTLISAALWNETHSKLLLQVSIKIKVPKFNEKLKKLAILKTNKNIVEYYVSNNMDLRSNKVILKIDGRI